MNLTRIANGLALTGLAALIGAGARIAIADDGHSRHDHGAKPQPAKTAKAEAKPKEVKSAPYPLDTCPVTGQELGSMGKPVVYDYQGREIRFCCPPCIKKFEANADKYLAEINAEIIALQTPDYPLDTCVVMGDPLEEGEIVDYVYKNRLLRFCCTGCIDDFNADPALYLGKLDDAVKAAAERQ